MIQLHRLRGRYLDFEFAVENEARLRVIERPGLWMQREALDAVLEGMDGLVRRVVPAGLAYGVLTREKRWLDCALLSILQEKKTGRTIAFNAYSYFEVELHGRPATILHLGLIMVDPAYQAGGFTWVVTGLPCLLVFLRNGLQPVWITSVSQVPAIIGKVAEAFAEVFPSPFAQTRRSFQHLAIARQVMARHREAFGVGPEAEFDADSFAIRNAYTGGSDNLKKTFAQATQHRDERANALCRTRLDYERGDDFLQVGSINFACSRDYLLRTVPRGSLPSLLYRVTFLLLAWLVLPAVHWFSPNRQWGDLRPWRF